MIVRVNSINFKEIVKNGCILKKNGHVDSCRNKKKMHACYIHHEVKSVCPSNEYVHVTQCKCNFLKNCIPSYIYIIGVPIHYVKLCKNLERSNFCA